MTQPPNPPPTPPSGPPPYSASGPGQPSYGDAKGFFGALFDFSFSHFITPKIVKVAYVISTVLLGLAFLGYLIASLASEEPALVVLVLLIGPIVILLYLIFIRMTLEFFVAIVRMSEDVHRRLPGV
jgi:hypothetical protein